LLIGNLTVRQKKAQGIIIVVVHCCDGGDD